MRGQITKIISNQYEVTCDKEVYVCKCRGIFRKNKITPLVGDFVVIDEKDLIILEVEGRKTELSRPPVANIDQALIVTSLSFPAFESNLLDKLLVMCELHHIAPVICLTKNDLLSKKERIYYKKVISYYKKLEYPVFYNHQVRKLKKLFRNKTTVLTGQTGAGKSSLLNRLDPNLKLETNEISKALGRGKHTTRTVQLWNLYGGKVLDTPGFSSLDFEDYQKDEIKAAFLEFQRYSCPYHDCSHLFEKECEVKKAVKEGKILESRYENYQKICKRKKEL